MHPIFLLSGLFHTVYGDLTLSVPTSGKCEEDVVLYCNTSAPPVSSSRAWTTRDSTLMINGKVVSPEYANKYSETVGDNFFSLTIHNMTLTDQNEYGCRFGFVETEFLTLLFECKASSVIASILPSRRLSLTADKLYPSAVFEVVVNNWNFNGSRICRNSTVYSSYYLCLWTSYWCLEAGSYTYRTVVITYERSSPFNESFMIVNPEAPVISNVHPGPNNRQVLYGKEGQTMTIDCTSYGGSPAPTVVWYKNNISESSVLAKSQTGVANEQNTFSVTLRHNWTLTAEDDGVTLICRSYYPEADAPFQESSTSIATLTFFLQPTKPVVLQVSEVTAGDAISVTCTTSNSRPASAIRWVYRGATYNATDRITLDQSTETYTTQSVFRRTVIADDDMKLLQCVVSHPALTDPLSASTNVSVLYPPYVTVEATNTSVTSNHITLTCEAKGNPEKYRYGRWLQRWPEYGVVAERPGVRMLQISSLTYEHSGTYSCSVSNSVKDFETEQEYIENSVYLLVKSYPKIVNTNETIRIFAKLGSQATAQISYYSNAGITDVRCFRSVNGSTKRENVCTTFSRDATIHLPVFSHSIPTQGVVTTVSIQVDSVVDLGTFEVAVTNQIGSTMVKLEIELEDEVVNKTFTTAFVGGTIGGLLAFLLIVVVVLIVLKRRGLFTKGKQKQTGQDLAKSMKEVSALEDSNKTWNTYEYLHHYGNPEENNAYDSVKESSVPESKGSDISDTSTYANDIRT